MNKIEKLKSIISDYLQYKKSKLWTETQEVMGLVDSEVESVIDGFCNIVSFWALLVVVFDLDVSYKDFIRTLFKKKMIKPNGYILAEKDDIAALFDVELEIEYFETWADIIDADRLEEGCFFQCAISGHFFACVKYNGEMWGVDTMRRGLWFKMADVLNPQKFKWLLKIG